MLLSFTSFYLFIGCGKSEKKTPSELPKKQEKQIDIYSKLDVCGCNKEAIEIIELAREIRDEFKTIKELKMKKNLLNRLEDLRQVTQNYLNPVLEGMHQKYFIPSECNNLNELDRKRSELFDLGIQLVQGERLKIMMKNVITIILLINIWFLNCFKLCQHKWYCY